MNVKAFSLAVLIVSFASVTLKISAAPLGTAFTYQGRLNEDGTPYTGNAEFQPTLWDAAAAGNTVAANNPAALIVGVTNGLFTLPLDFGESPFSSGAERWLQLEVRTSIDPFALLSPRQKLTATPYALTAGNLTGALPASQLSGPLPSANLGGTYSGTVTFNNAGNSFTGNGAGLTTLNASQLTTGSVPDGRLAGNVARTNQVWLLRGNSGTAPGTQFLGTTDNQPLELRVNTQRALRLEPNTNGGPNVIGGASHNIVGGGVAGATVAGGGAANYQGFAFTNSVLADFGVVGGGFQNRVAPGATAASIAGGYRHDIGTDSSYSAIGGGNDNSIAADSGHSTIAGGGGNEIRPSAHHSAIGGGSGNNIGISSTWATIAGGIGNAIGTNSEFGAIGGGSQNSIGNISDYSTIAGGLLNSIGNRDYFNTIGGGRENKIGYDSWWTTIAGGYANAIGTNSGYSAIGGGSGNDLLDNSAYAAIPGGRSNVATNYAFAAGRRAKANHTGAFVWADSTDVDFASTTANQFNIRATGGVRFSDDTPNLSFGSDTRQMLNLYSTTYGLGVQVSTLYQRSNSRFSWFKGGTHSSSQNDPGTGGAVLMTLTDAGLTVNGAFVSVSDRYAKEGFETVKPGEVLDKVLTLPLSRWTFKADEARSRHLGPMAQDFHAAFGLGADDKHIATVDANGVALAAIQGLNQKVESGQQKAEIQIAELKAENAELKAQNDSLNQRLERLENLFNKQNGGPK